LSEQKSSEKPRKNGMDTVREMARDCADRGMGVQSCPYHSTPHKTVWLEAFFARAQISLNL
jgi:hypothetical protein